MSQRIDYLWTTDIDLASVLVSLHFKMRSREPVTRIYRAGGKQQDTFYFNQTANNPDFGEIQAKDVVKVWKGEDVENKALQSHVDYMRTAFKNRPLLIDCIKTNVKPMMHTVVDGRDVFLPLDASPELQRKMKRMIEETA